MPLPHELNRQLAAAAAAADDQDPRQLRPSALVAVAPRFLLAPALLLLDLRAYLLLGDLRPPARPAALVLGLDHLVHVLQLEADLVLVGARGLPVHLLGARPGVPLA